MYSMDIMQNEQWSSLRRLILWQDNMDTAVCEQYPDFRFFLHFKLWQCAAEAIFCCPTENSGHIEA